MMTTEFLTLPATFEVAMNGIVIRYSWTNNRKPFCQTDREESKTNQTPQIRKFLNADWAFGSLLKSVLHLSEICEDAMTRREGGSGVRLFGV